MKQLLWLIVLSSFFSYSMDNTVNCLALLPPEIQSYIADFIPCFWLETDEESCKKLETETVGTDKESIETKSYTIFIDQDENLSLLDKEENKISQIIPVNNKYREHNEENPAFFALSPDNQQLIFETIHSYKNSLYEQNGIWLVNLKTNDKQFINLNKFFPNKLMKLNHLLGMNDYEKEGYQYIDVHFLNHSVQSLLYILKQPFSHMAIANDGTIAIADKSNLQDIENGIYSGVYLINPTTKKCSEINRFRHDLLTIKTMRFNPQSTDLFIDFRDEKDSQLLSKLAVKKVKPHKTLTEYFDRMCVCKSKQLQ